MTGTVLQEITEALEQAVTLKGERLVAASEESPVLLVFLRHAGCIFCREALADLAVVRRAIAETGMRIVLVHMGDTAAMDRLFQKYGLAGVDRIADTDQRLYRAFGLKRGKLRQLLGPKVIRRGMQAMGRGFGAGFVSADSFQMPGLFVLHRGRILGRFRHQTAADRPDYLQICREASETGVRS